jgi:alanine dehydrogenase
MDKKTGNFLKFSQRGELLPLEEKLATGNKSKTLKIGIPKEISKNENRIPLVPESVNLLVENGNEVIIERNAGKSAHFPDSQYAEAGAILTDSLDEIYKSEIIIKVSPPCKSELSLMNKGKTIFSSVFLPDRDKRYFEILASKRIKSIGYEFIEDKSGSFPVIKSMSEIVGNTAILVAAEHLSDLKYGRGKMLGGFPGLNPSEVVIIGAGTVAEYAARTAIGMGASVKIFDDAVYKLRDIQKTLGSRVFTSILQPKVLLKALKTADVVIAAKHSQGELSQCMVSEEMVMQMNTGSVIVDVSIDQGGCFETSRATSHEYPVFQVHDVTHYCVPNIASRVPHTASYALSNYLTPVLLNISEFGGVENMLKQDHTFCKGVYSYNGILTNKTIGKKFNLPYQNLELLLSAF